MLEKDVPKQLYLGNGACQPDGSCSCLGDNGLAGTVRCQCARIYALVKASVVKVPASVMRVALEETLSF